MPDARSLFSAEDHSRITAAVVSAESKTAAEIVPVVANISGKYERAEDSVGVWGSLIAVSIAWLCAPHPVLETGDWSGAHPTTHLVLLLVSLLVGFIAGTSIGAQFSGLKQLFTSKDQMAEEVWRRARAIFFDQRIHHTTGATGVLIYLSLFEHRAVILADQAILEKVGQARMDELCANMIQAIHKEGFTAALTSTISALAVDLEKAAPRAHDDVNELDDALVILD